MRHPGDIELLELADGGDVGEAVRAHVAACQACSATVAELGRVREELRTLAPVEPPGTLVPPLPRRERARRTPRLRGRRLAVALVPLGGALAAALVLATGGGDGGRRAEPPPAAVRAKAVAPASEPAARATTAPLHRVRGPVAAVAAVLRRAGLRAAVEGDVVVVTGATPRAVERALGSRSSGPVAIVLR